jgi:hypothetical protein
VNPPCKFACMHISARVTTELRYGRACGAAWGVTAAVLLQGFMHRLQAKNPSTAQCVGHVGKHALNGAQKPFQNCNDLIYVANVRV